MPETTDEKRIESEPDKSTAGLAYQVRDAAAAILAQGNRPTVAAVRGILGGGNANRINEALTEFYRDIGAQLREGCGRLPETELPPAFLEGAKTLYKVAADLAREALARDRKEAADQVAAAQEKTRTAQLAQQAAEDRLATLVKDVQRLEAVNAEREAALAREIERAEAAARHVVHLQTEMEARDRIAREQYSQLEARTHQLELKVAAESARAERSESLLKQAKADHAQALTQERAHYERQLSARAGSELLLRQQLDALRAQLQTAESARAELQGHLAGVQAQLAQLQGEREALAADKERVVGKLAGAQTTAAALEKTVVERTAQIETLEQRVAMLSEECQRLQVQLARVAARPNDPPG
jgi:chromosome segregation ATPase